MCCVNSDKAKYEVIVSSKSNDYICTINFISITTVCRFIEDVDFNNCKIDVFNKHSSKHFDVDILMEIWKSNNIESEVVI